MSYNKQELPTLGEYLSSPSEFRICLRSVHHVLSVSLDCLSVIAPSVFSNVYMERGAWFRPILSAKVEIKDAYSIQKELSYICTCASFLSLSTLQGTFVIVWYLDLQLSVQSMPNTTKFVSSNPVHCEVYMIHYVKKFVSDLRQVGRFNRFIPPNTISEILLQVALNSIIILTP